MRKRARQPRNCLRTGIIPARPYAVPRKIALIVAAILVPGGFIALVGTWLFKTLGQTERGRKVVARARLRVLAWMAARLPALRHEQAA